MRNCFATWAAGILLGMASMSCFAAGEGYPPLPGTNAAQTKSSATDVPQSINSAAAEKAQAAHEAALKQKAFDALLNQYFPLSPNQIHQFKDRAALQQKANAQPPGPAPAHGTSNIVTVNLKPGANMPVIRIGQGMITSLVFIDANGDVWPIQSYSIGDPSAFNVNWDRKSGVLMIQGEKLYAQTNVSVMLKGLSIPVMMTMLVGQHDWDYLDYIRINQNQPAGKNPIYSGVSQAPSFLISLLNGVPPTGAVALESSSDNVKAWTYRNKYLVLTSGTLMSPAWTSRVNGPGVDAYHAYVVPQAPMILVSYHGQLEHVSLTMPAAQYGVNNGDLGSLSGAPGYGAPNVSGGYEAQSVRVKNVNAPKETPAATTPSGSGNSTSTQPQSQDETNSSRLSNVVSQAKSYLGGQ